MRLRAETWVSVPRHEVFSFFADAANLQILTPPWLQMAILTPKPIVMKAGARIAYRIRLHGVPLRWESEISAFDPPVAFVDEQRRGPYRRWVHTHRFLESEGGTALLDEVEFDLIGARLIGGLVARDLTKIFTYRHSALLAIFKQSAPWPPPRIDISR